MRDYELANGSPQQALHHLQQGLYGGSFIGDCSSGYMQQLQPAQWVYCQGHCSRPSSPLPREFRIFPYGTEVRMDYGEELKVWMADPIKGIDLREAVQKLKEALLELEEKK